MQLIKVENPATEETAGGVRIPVKNVSADTAERVKACFDAIHCVDATFFGNIVAGQDGDYFDAQDGHFQVYGKLNGAPANLEVARRNEGNNSRLTAEQLEATLAALGVRQVEVGPVTRSQRGNELYVVVRYK